MTYQQTGIKNTWLRLAFLMAIVGSLLIWPAAAVLAEASGGSTGVSSSAAVGMPIPLAGIRIPDLVGRIIKYALGLAGVIAMAMFIYGGLTWMTASGNQERITSAKKTVVWAVIGLVLTFSSYAIARIVIDLLTK